MSPFDQIQMSPLMLRGDVMAEVVQMSLKESDRYAVIVQVIERTMGQSDAGDGSTFRCAKSNAWCEPSVKTQPKVRSPNGGGLPATGASQRRFGSGLPVWCGNITPTLAAPWFVSI